MPFLGDQFRAAREARQLSLADVSEQIHIRTVYLQSIEEEDWKTIGATVYVRGFIRTYARFIGLDPEGSVDAYNAEVADNGLPLGVPASVATFDRPGPATGRLPLAGEQGMRGSPSRPARGARQQRAGGPSIWIVLAGGFTFCLVAYAIYSFVNLRNQGPGLGRPAAADVAAVASPPASVAANATAKPRRPHETLAVRITARSWLSVAIDGSSKLEGTFDPGVIKVFHGRSATMRAGNAGGVDVTVNGQSLGTLGAPGTVVERTFALGQAGG